MSIFWERIDYWGRVSDFHAFHGLGDIECEVFVGCEIVRAQGFEVVLVEAQAVTDLVVEGDPDLALEVLLRRTAAFDVPLEKKDHRWSR